MFICKALPKDDLPRSISYSSPELKEFCKTAKERQKEGQMAKGKNLPELSTKSDVWALGVVFCEIISMMPQFSWNILRNEKSTKMKSFERIVDAIYSKNEQINQFCIDGICNIITNPPKNLRNFRIFGTIQRHFPYILPLLEVHFRRGSALKLSSEQIKAIAFRSNKLIKDLINFNDIDVELKSKLFALSNDNEMIFLFYLN